MQSGTTPAGGATVSPYGFGAIFQNAIGTAVQGVGEWLNAEVRGEVFEEQLKAQRLERELVSTQREARLDLPQQTPPSPVWMKFGMIGVAAVIGLALILKILGAF